MTRAPLGSLPLKDAIARCIDVWQLETTEAWEKLRLYLDADKVPSFMQGKDGGTFTAQGVWLAEKNDHAYATGKLIYFSLYQENATAFDAFVDSKQLEKLLSGDLIRSPETIGAYSTQKPSGRRRHPDEELFWIEACRMAVSGEQASIDDRKQTKKAFIDAMEDWAKTGMNSPYGRDAIEKKITKLWQAIRATR